MSKRALFDIALKAFLFLSPMFFYKAWQLSLARGLFFVFGSFALFGISLALEPKRKFANPWIALFLLWAFIRIFMGKELGNTSNEWFNFWLLSAGFIYVFAGILLFHTVYCHAENPKNYLTPLLVVCGVNFVLVVAQLIGHDFMWTHAPTISGFFAIDSQLGQYSAMSLPVLAFISPWLMAIPLFLLCIARSISSVVALSAGVVFWSWQKKTKWILLLLIIPLLAGCFNYKFIIMSWRNRPMMWERTLRAALKRPYIGHGYNSFSEVVISPGTKDLIGGREFNKPQCDSIHTSQELGFPAMIFIGGFFISLWKKFKAKQGKDKLTYFLATAILISLVNGCGQTLIRYASVAGTFVVLLAFLYIKLEEI